MPRLLRYSLASGSMVEACVALVRVSPWKSASRYVRPMAVGWSPGPLPGSIGLTLFIEAHAWIIVPSTLKWSHDRNRFI